MERLTKDTLLWVGELNVQEGIRILLTVEQLNNDINRWSVTRPLHYLHNIQYLRVKTRITSFRTKKHKKNGINKNKKD